MMKQASPVGCGTTEAPYLRRSGARLSVVLLFHNPPALRLYSVQAPLVLCSTCKMMCSRQARVKSGGNVNVRLGHLQLLRVPHHTYFLSSTLCHPCLCPRPVLVLEPGDWEEEVQGEDLLSDDEGDREPEDNLDYKVMPAWWHYRGRGQWLCPGRHQPAVPHVPWLPEMLSLF